MNAPITPKPYGSARDLPSVQELEQQMAGLRLLGFLLSKAQRHELKQLRQEHRRITRTVDTFYALLGPRNWVFHGDLNLAAIEAVIDTNDPAEAERRFILYHKEGDRLAFSLGRLHRLEAMRPRRQLLDNALQDYMEGRYYSTVLVVLAVMDGFVNDLDASSRKGLHTRPSEDMVAWDSVAGHHLGLSHAHESFLKSFRKTDEKEVTELYRNGIMHGVLVNFDNDVVATKAWNRLFAVADWAEARARQAAPTEPTPSLRESLVRWQAAQTWSKRIEQWQPHDHEGVFEDEEPCDLARACADFLHRWEKRQYGLLGGHLMTLGSKSPTVGEQARLAKDLYATYELTSWSIQKVRHVAAAVAQVDVALTVDGSTHQTSLRWVRTDGAGQTAPEWEAGAWMLSPYGPTLFLA